MTTTPKTKIATVTLTDDTDLGYAAAGGRCLTAGTYRVEMPVDYDPARVTGEDILCDPALRVVRDDEDVAESTDVRCECGTITGEACPWRGSRSETVIVEWMPPYLRASHEAARNAGVYPHNGAERLRVHHDCAERLIETDGEWTDRVESR